MIEYKVDCEVAMSKLVSHLREDEPAFTRADVFDAFENCDGDLQAHLRKALKYNVCADIHELLDKACACDMLVEYNGHYIAVDWTDSLENILPKQEKQKWLTPVYKYLGIEYSVVCKVTKYHLVNSKTKELIARANITKQMFEHFEYVINKGKANSKLELEVKVTF